MSDTQKEVYNNGMNMMSSISFYSPLIILIFLFILSTITGAINKFGFYVLWCFIITGLRWILYKPNISPDIPSICDSFIPKDYTYSTYILSFTMMYFITPMLIISNKSNKNALDYGVIGLFIAYISLDIFIKKTLICIPSFLSSLVLFDILAGLFFGYTSAYIMYKLKLQKYLYANEMKSMLIGNKEICAVPSKQQFKCNLYKNGELVSSILK